MGNSTQTSIQKELDTRAVSVRGSNRVPLLVWKQLGSLEFHKYHKYVTLGLDFAMSFKVSLKLI